MALSRAKDSWDHRSLSLPTLSESPVGTGLGAGGRPLDYGSKQTAKGEGEAAEDPEGSGLASVQQAGLSRGGIDPQPYRPSRQHETQ